MGRLIQTCTIAAITLWSMPARADTPDPAPTLSTDPATHATTVIGPHHLHKVALNLNVTDWWLSGTIAGGGPGDVQLVVDAHSATWALFGQATDAAGAKLPVTVLARQPSTLFPGKILERLAVTLPRTAAEKARREGLAVTVSGTRVIAGATRSISILVPAQAMAVFLDGYDKVAGRTADAAPAPSPDHSPAAVPTTPPAAAPAVVKSAPTRTPAPGAVPPPAATTDIPPVPSSPLVSLPGNTTMTSSVDAPGPPADAATDGASAGVTGTWIPTIGLQFVPTSSGAMVLAIRPGSIAETKGIVSGDFIDSADGVPISNQAAADIAAKIAGATMLHMIAAGDIKIR